MNTTNTNARTVIGLGEVLWDCFPDQHRPGGAPANVAYHAQQLGLRGLICSRVGNDPPGAELRSHLHEHGLDLSCVQTDPDHPTGTVDITMTGRDAPAYTIQANVAWDFLSIDANWVEALKGAAAICFGTLAQRSAHNRATYARAFSLAPEALLVYDVNLRAPFYEADWLDASLRRADVIKLNEAELQTLDELLHIGGTNIEEQTRRLRERYDARLVCVTRGGAACLLTSANATISDAPTAIEVVDAVGAGDAFNAGLIYSLLNDWPLAKMASFANRLAGLVAARHGAMPNLENALRRLPQL